MNSGIKGIEKLNMDIVEMKKKFSPVNLKQNLELAYSGISSRGGPAVSRKQIAQFLMTCEDIFNVDFNPLIEKLISLSKEWNILANIFIRYSISLEEATLKHLTTKLTLLSIYEKETLELLSEYVYKINLDKENR